MLFNNKKKKSLLNSRAVVNFKNTIFFVFREREERNVDIICLFNNGEPRVALKVKTR